MKQIRFQAEPDIRKLREFSRQLRRDTARMIHYAGAGHIGGALGIADFISALYGWALEFDSDKLTNPNRDRIVLSNGHTCAVLVRRPGKMRLLPHGGAEYFQTAGFPSSGSSRP